MEEENQDVGDGNILCGICSGNDWNLEPITGHEEEDEDGKDGNILCL